MAPPRPNLADIALSGFAECPLWGWAVGTVQTDRQSATCRHLHSVRECQMTEQKRAPFHPAASDSRGVLLSHTTCCFPGDRGLKINRILLRQDQQSIQLRHLPQDKPC